MVIGSCCWGAAGGRPVWLHCSAPNEAAADPKLHSRWTCSGAGTAVRATGLSSPSDKEGMEVASLAEGEPGLQRHPHITLSAEQIIEPQPVHGECKSVLDTGKVRGTPE